MRTVILLILLLVSLSNSYAQYTPVKPDSVSLEQQAPSDIRKMFLDLEGSPRIHALARKSRWNTILSVISYTAGAVYALGGLYGLSEQVSGGNSYGVLTELAVVGFGLGGAVGITLGIWQTHLAKKHLKKAVELYNHR